MLADNDILMEDAPPLETLETQSEADPTSEIQQISLLLKLPIEVFQTITWHMDVGTFFASLLTCKYFFAAAQCRPNLIRKINDIPGLKLGLNDSEKNLDLFLEFRRRAAESGCAAGVLSNIQRWAPASRTPVSGAVFSPADASQAGSIAQLATVHSHGTIHIYDLGKHYLRHKRELEIKPSEDEYGCRTEILKMAFSTSSRDLAVLYRSRNDPNEPLEERKSSNISEWDGPSYRLVTFHRLHAKTKGYFYSSKEQEKREINNFEEEEPVGFALASNGNACIAWKHPARQSETTIWLIGRSAKLMEADPYDPNPEVLKIEDSRSQLSSRLLERLIFNVQFVDNDKNLNFYKPGNPIHSWYTPTCNPSEGPCGPIFVNTAYVNVQNEEASRLEECHVGMPFHGDHASGITVDWSPALKCQTTFLAIGMTKYCREESDHPDVFIVQADTTTSSINCDHSFNLDDGRKIAGWKAIALLAGYRAGTSSLGTVMAISPGATKIACATWSRVLVWSFNPRLLHQGGLEHYFPAHDYNMRKGIGRLRPTLLSSEGVVHTMLWTEENQLYATTDRGLVRWDMGHMSEGEKETLSLAYDAWPDTAVAAPIGGRRAQQRRPVPFR